MTISIVIVTFNSVNELAGCLAHLPDDAEVIVVDQGSADGSAAEARRLRGDARVIVADVNRGFGAGCNLGARNARGDVLIFLNPDTQASAPALRRLAGTVASTGGSLVGPTLFDERGNRVTRCRHWSTPGRELVSLVLPRAGRSRWGEDIPPHDPVYRVGGRVPFVQGACLAVGASAFAEAGGFDERYFLYGEEEVLARRLLRTGRHAQLEPRAEIVHSGQASTTQVSSFALRQLYRSRALIYADRYGRARGAMSSAILAGGLVFLLLTSPVRRRVGYRKLETATWCRAALAGLASGVLRRPVMPPGAESAP